MAKVCDAFDIDEVKLSEKAEEDDYWKKCEKFWDDVKHRDFETISVKQEQWLEQIQERLQV